MIDFNEFDKIKISKELGAGVIGTTYLAKYKNKQYALKIQHILEKDKIKDFNNEMWRELDLYEYINNMDKEEQLFFTRLHGYKIYNNCKHIQKRPLIKGPIEFMEQLKKLDESEWCVKYLLDYKGDITFHKFLSTKKQTVEQIYSLMLQICKIIYTLYKGGYSHNDLHQENIMINKTTKKYFTFMDKKIPYNGYQLSAIDFGEVLHKKFDIKYTGSESNFITDRERFMFKEIFSRTYTVINNFSKNYETYKQKKKGIMPWGKKNNFRDYIQKKILLKHRDFVAIISGKYFNLFPGSEKIFNELMKIIELKKHKDDTVKKLVNEIAQNKITEIDSFWNCMDRIIYEFDLFFPKTYSKYFGWCSYFDSPLPKNVVQDLFAKNNYKDYIDYLIKKIEE
jgi:serine/threonine protein kinase